MIFAQFRALPYLLGNLEKDLDNHRQCGIDVARHMNKSLELTINLEVYEPPEGFKGAPEEIAGETGVPVEAVMATVLFRGNGGFIAVLTGMNRRLNLKALMHELDNQWVVYPNEEELRELGSIDLNHPIVLASDPRTTIIIDAQLMKHKFLVFKGVEGQLFKIAMSSLMIATRAKPAGGISLPKSFG